MKLRFYKDNIGWFIDIPWWPAWLRGHLAMICGADTLLDKISKRGTEVILQVSTNYFNDFDNVLTRFCIFGILSGAVYDGGTSSLINNTIIKQNQLWLCAVALVIFCRYPKKIYYNVISYK